FSVNLLSSSLPIAIPLMSRPGEESYEDEIDEEFVAPHIVAAQTYASETFGYLPKNLLGRSAGYAGGSQKAVGTASDEILSEYNVQGTYWDTQTDAGGCSMPSGNYLVLDALALGQATSLGQLAFQPKYCGQVFRVNCGGQSVNAVVASTCNFGTTTCGVDLIKRTWNYATGNKSPGVASCTVSLTSINPLPGSSPLCFYRPNSEFNNNYYKLLSVYNTAGKLVKSASLDGIAGSISSGNWYQFQAGSNQFSSSSTVSFTFEDGSKTSFALSACTRPSSVKIWTSDSTSIPQLSSTLPANTLTKTKTTTSSSSSATSAALLGDWYVQASVVHPSIQAEFLNVLREDPLASNPQHRCLVTGSPALQAASAQTIVVRLSIPMTAS
ncbi:hypothetical protein HK096_009172, partial [Nowakowskiella sp. JEL0078]